jgi:hypothetical protein
VPSSEVKEAAVTSFVPLDLAASPRDRLYVFGTTWPEESGHA